MRRFDMPEGRTGLIWARVEVRATSVLSRSPRTESTHISCPSRSPDSRAHGPLYECGYVDSRLETPSTSQDRHTIHCQSHHTGAGTASGHGSEESLTLASKQANNMNVTDQGMANTNRQNIVSVMCRVILIQNGAWPPVTC